MLFIGTYLNKCPDLNKNWGNFPNKISYKYKLILRKKNPNSIHNNILNPLF